MALGITNRTRKTGLEKAMTIEEVSFIAAFAQRAHNTSIERLLRIQAQSLLGVKPIVRRGKVLIFSG